jgi:hypothetical protein
MQMPWLVLFTAFHHISMFKSTGANPSTFRKFISRFMFKPRVSPLSLPLDKIVSVARTPCDPPKLCKDCVHFRPITMRGDTVIGNYYGECKYFSKVDVITGEHSYMMANDARISNVHCTIRAIYFEPKNTGNTQTIHVEDNMFVTE